MVSFGEKWTALLNAGKIEEARAMLEAEGINAKYEPDTGRQEKGNSVQFTKEGKSVELDGNGNWRPVDQPLR